MKKLSEIEQKSIMGGTYRVIVYGPGIHNIVGQKDFYSESEANRYAAAYDSLPGFYTDVYRVS